MQLRMRKSGCIALSILLVCSLFLGVTPVKAANEDVIVLSAGNVTLDLSVSTETIVVIDDGLTVNYADPLNMTVLIEVTGSGNVLDYDNTISAAVSGSFGATLGSLTFEGETDAATWQALLRSVTLSNESMEYLPLANEQRTITITALGVMDTKIVDVIAPGGDLSGGTGGDSSYTIDEITPTITEQPVDMTVNTGETASLSVTASVYAGELSYKWYRNITGNVNYPPDWQEVAGATNSTYTVPTELAGTTYYYVDVINTAGDQTVTIFSNFVQVTVNAVTNAEAPSITQQPSGTTVDEGESASLSVTATGTGTLSYQWYSNATNSNSGGTLIEGATSATYDAPTNTAGETYYYLVVTNTDDTATGNQTATETSNAVLVTVNEAAPEAPTNLSAAAGHGRVVLSWTGSANADSYLVYQGTAEGTYGAAVDAGSTGYTATGLTNGTTYYFAVKAVNAGVSSGYSNEASATPTSPPAPTYAITYNGNGNTGGNVPTNSIRYTQGASVSIAGNTGNLAKTDYTFAGWNTKADGSGTTYAANSTLTMTSANVTLYALWQVDAPIISTVAGTGSGGYSGDGGLADKAQLKNPYGVAVDSNGNVYIADTSNNRIRKVATDGAISTMAGTRIPGYSGDGGPADKAKLNHPSGIAVDSSGNVYIADRYNNRIRKITPDGTINTVAGTGIQGYSGDGGPADKAKINSPTGITVDSSGNVYIADRYNNRIRKITPDGTINTVAGTGIQGYSGDGGLADKAQLSWPFGVVLDNNGNLYISDFENNRVRKVTSDGIISTVAGTAASGYSGDGGSAKEAQFRNPSGIAIDSSGNVYIAEYRNSRIRKIAADGTITTVAGTGSSGYSGDGGPADKAKVNRPLGVAVDDSGNVFIADTFNNRIRKVTMNIDSNPKVPTNLGTITQSNVNGQSTTNLVVNDQKLQDQINSKGKNGVITIQNTGSSDNFKATLNGQSIQNMGNNQQVLNVQTNSASYSLPANLLKSSISSTLGVSEQDAGNAEVSVTIAEKPDTTVTNVTKGKSKLASKVVDFSITVTIGDSTTELNNFYSTYVSRSFDLTQSVNTKKSVGVVVNADGTLSPVPTEFVNVEGKQVAVLKRNGNSTYAVLENEVTLNDIAGHWGEDIIQLLADKLIVTGFGDGSFRPDQQVTRAEFVALIVRALGLVSTQTGIGSFTDVTSDDWYAGALAAAKEAGLVNGYADGSFRADQSITRQDASVLLGNAITFLQLQREQTQADAEQALSNYRDADQVSGYAQQAVGLASSLDILNGQGDGTFQPKANTTRAESATMIKKLMDLAGFISY